MWYRVFAPTAAAVAPADLLAHLHDEGLDVSGRFRGESNEPAEWFAAEMRFSDASPVTVERYLTAVDEIRGELNAWAAFLETADWSEHSPQLMEGVITAVQLFALRRPIDHADDVRLDRLCLTLCRWLATRTGGFYQVDDQGFFTASGEMLVREY